MFERAWKRQTCVFQGKQIQQVKSFKYLGLIFQHNLSWVSHRRSVINLAKITSLSISRFFFFPKGNKYIPAAVRIFNAKVSSQLLYGSPIWLSGFNIDVERIQSSFLYKIFGFPHCISYVALCLEAGRHRLDYLAWCAFIKFWLKVCFNASFALLLQDLLADS